MSEIEIGLCEGEFCNRNGCIGLIKREYKEGRGGCSCFTTNPPCSYCTDSVYYCNVCDWRSDDE